jgi:pyrroloquinoline quinone biosynthesis protein D
VGPRSDGTGFASPAPEAKRAPAEDGSEVTLSTNFIPQRVQGSEAARLGNDFVVLDGSGKILRGLNPTAARIWELIDGQRTAAEIAHQIALEFAVSNERVLEDLLSFLSLLFDRRLLVQSLIGPAEIQEQGR